MLLHKHFNITGQPIDSINHPPPSCSPAHTSSNTALSPLMVLASTRLVSLVYTGSFLSITSHTPNSACLTCFTAIAFCKCGKDCKTSQCFVGCINCSSKNTTNIYYVLSCFVYFFRDYVDL